jgi:hypothetical protein
VASWVAEEDAQRDRNERDGENDIDGTNEHASEYGYPLQMTEIANREGGVSYERYA